MILVFKIKVREENTEVLSSRGSTFEASHHTTITSFLPAAFTANTSSSGVKARWQVWEFQNIRYCFVYLNYNLCSNGLRVQIKHTAN